ncbi:hypothetical protein CGMCC3_g17891, partial [Colletotrichum fructicola]
MLSEPYLWVLHVQSTREMPGVRAVDGERADARQGHPQETIE